MASVADQTADDHPGKRAGTTRRSMTLYLGEDFVSAPFAERSERYRVHNDLESTALVIPFGASTGRFTGAALIWLRVLRYS